ncbi:hypothetical protein FSP39_018786 [Pinctada imbricata]|uniref:SAM domain-containing protein n=1 Tax=Pinctada imbricata TaxID=66713 RepID=A0AA89BXL1_PINIB|nr:hypothetical protein FSP39_018786 [Pinctada imbricata]
MEIGGMTLKVDKPPEDRLDVKTVDDQAKHKDGAPIVKKNPRSKTKPLHFWTTADVNKWLRKYGGGLHDKYGELLSQQEITGRTLIRMNEMKLEKIGISKPEHRKDLMQHILRLRLKHEMSDLKNLDQKGFELKLPDSKTKYQSTKDKDSKERIDKL